MMSHHLNETVSSSTSFTSSSSSSSRIVQLFAHAYSRLPPTCTSDSDVSGRVITLGQFAIESVAFSLFFTGLLVWAGWHYKVYHRLDSGWVTLSSLTSSFLASSLSSSSAAASSSSSSSSSTVQSCHSCSSSWLRRSVDFVLLIAVIANYVFILHDKLENTMKPDNIWFMLQPCHMQLIMVFVLLILNDTRQTVHTAVVQPLSSSSSSNSSISTGGVHGFCSFLFNVYLNTLIAAFLGLVAMDTSYYSTWPPFLSWLFQHLLLVFVPLLFIAQRRFVVTRHPHMFCIGFAIIGLYHFGILSPLSILTGVNLNYQMCPPGPASLLGVYYRVWVVPILAVMQALLRYGLVGGFEWIIGAVPIKRVSSLQQPQVRGGGNTSAQNSETRHPAHPKCE